MLIQNSFDTIAENYETQYEKQNPIKTGEQHLLATALSSMLKNKTVLEVAAGTGYWTWYLSQTAKKIMVTDIESKFLEYAKQKTYKCPVSFQIEDAYKLTFPKNSFNAGVSNFWLSYVPLYDIPLFLEGFHRVLKKNSTVFMSDTVLQSVQLPAPHQFNTISDTHFENSKPESIKHQFTKEELHQLFSRYDPKFSSNNIFYGDYYWYLYYTV
jgi:ubiquinone/menaquinone biosynthesis C-methylase UbiE